MNKKYKVNYKNRPPHKAIESGYYFITARTPKGEWFLRPDKYKKILLEIIKEKAKKFSFQLIAYAILQNHYHLIVHVKNPEDLKKFVTEVNGASSKKINDADCMIGRKFWWNYFESFIKNEADFFCHLNYIHQNPIKHKVSDCLSYKFSSYNSWEKIKGKDYLDDCFAKYPIVDFAVFNDDFEAS